MAEAKTEQEPSIEEILESIRQIISEDGDGAEAGKTAAVPAPEPLNLQPEKAPPAPASASLPPLDLINKIDTSPLDLSLEEPSAPEPEPAPPAPAPVPVAKVEAVPEKKVVNSMTEQEKAGSLVSAETATVVTEHLSKLLANDLAVEAEHVGGTGKVTLEDLTRDLMKPLIKAWLDQHLPALIEKIVQKEVEKLARRVLDR